MMNWMSSVFFKVCLFGFIGLACPTALLKAEGIIKGTVLDKNSGEPVILLLLWDMRITVIFTEYLRNITI